MSKLNRLKGESHSDYMKRLEEIKSKPNIILGNEPAPSVTADEYNAAKISENAKKNKNLALSFKYLTENKDYNFSYFKKDKTTFDAFVSRLNSCLVRITSMKVKDLYDPMFKDRFPYKNLNPGVYKNSSKCFANTEELISIEFGSKKNERIVLFYDGNPETGDNILYVLLFDFNFNHPAYNHGK